jgi:hypothetical protein
VKKPREAHFIKKLASGAAPETSLINQYAIKRPA